MAVANTGNIVAGTVAGLGKELKGTWGTELSVPNKILYISGTPDGLVTSTTGSDIAFDVAGGAIYIGDITNGAGGSAWSELSTD